VPPGPAGLARVEVKFLIDANGILQVMARDLRAGAQQTIEVQPSYGLTDTEIERILEESIEHAEEDFAERQLIEARTEADTILHATAKSLADTRSVELPGGERAAIDAAVANLRAAVTGPDYKLIRQRIDELNQATMHLAELLMNSALQAAVQGKRLDEV
jgi:molecular chaperone DnaK